MVFLVGLVLAIFGLAIDPSKRDCYGIVRHVSSKRNTFSQFLVFLGMILIAVSIGSWTLHTLP